MVTRAGGARSAAEVTSSEIGAALANGSESAGVPTVCMARPQGIAPATGVFAELEAAPPPGSARQQACAAA
jgi:hypothetical protein